MTSNKKHWRKLSSREIFRSKYVHFRCESLELPDKRVMPNYYVLDFPDWVNIVAVTKKEKHIILIEQFRPPVNTVTLEIPGGSLDPQSQEDHETAARRELEEETGYSPGSMKLLGAHNPNPALQSNRLWTYLALDCELTQPQKQDEFEDIDVVTVPIEEALKLSRDGTISHSLVMVAFYLALPDLNLLKSP